MSHEPKSKIMKAVYNSEARKNRVKGTPETVRLRSVMNERGISDVSDGLTKLVDNTNELSPQFPSALATMHTKSTTLPRPSCPQSSYHGRTLLSRTSYPLACPSTTSSHLSRSLFREIAKQEWSFGLIIIMDVQQYVVRFLKNNSFYACKRYYFDFDLDRTIPCFLLSG